MASNYPTIQQHEPLRIPSNWGTPEKRLIAQLEEIFDDIYRRFGRLKLSDLSESLRREVSSAIDGVKTHSTLIEQNAKAIELKADGVKQEDGSVAAQAVSTSSVKVTANGVDITTDGTFTVDGANFSVDADGRVTASGAVIDGVVRSNGALTLTQLDIHIGEDEPEVKRKGMVWIKPGKSTPVTPTMTQAVYSYTFASSTQRAIPTNNPFSGTFTGAPAAEAGKHHIYVFEVPLFAYRPVNEVIISFMIDGVIYGSTFKDVFTKQGTYTVTITREVTNATGTWLGTKPSIPFSLMANESVSSSHYKDNIRNPKAGYTAKLTCYSYSE